MLLGQDLQDLVRLPQCGVGAADDRVEVLAASGKACAQVVEDEAEALRIGQAVDVLDDVQVHLLAVVLERQEPLAGSRLAVGDLLELRWRLDPRCARLGRLAVDELLTEERLRADDARGIAEEVLEGRVGDLHDDHGLPGVVLAVRVYLLPGHGDIHGADGAHVRPGDPHLLALHDEPAVVEVAADQIAVLVGGGRPQDHHENGNRSQQGEDEEGASHGPGGTSEGSHSPVSAPSSRNGFEPGIGCVEPPGQRVKMPKSSPEYCCEVGCGLSTWVALL